MNRYFKSFFWGSLIISLFSSSYLLYYKLTDGFRIASITSHLTYHPQWETQSPTPDEKFLLTTILDQPYSYLGKGGKAYAFQSKDGLYVLKFFKFKYLRPNFLNQLISKIPFFEGKNTHEMQRRHRKFYGVYQGYKWAYDLNKTHSGLIYLHLNPTFNQFGYVDLYDKLGRKHSLDLDQVVFMVQKKARLFNEILAEKLDKGNVTDAQVMIFKVIDMFVNQYQKGLYDRDLGVLHNTGFVDDRPIHFDMGKMTYDESMKDVAHYKAHLILVSNKIDGWIKNHYPQFYPGLHKTLEDKLSTVFNEKFQFALDLNAI